MKVVLDILKGVIIGIANVVPGVSGGTIAVSMGIYEDIIYALNSFIKTPIKAIKLIWKYALGMVLGIACSIFGIVYLFEVAPIPTSTLFVGMIIGALPSLVPKVEGEELTVRDAVVFGILAAIVMLLPVLDNEVVTNIEMNVSNIIITFFLGIIAAVTAVVPGVSGSAILMVLGYYTFIMTTIENTIVEVLAFNIAGAISTGAILIPMAIGVVIGIFLTAKLIEKWLKLYPNTVYWGVIALVVTSPFPIILKMNLSNITVEIAIISTILLIAGMIFAAKLSKKEE
ncbi:MAG: DUF368 domain-containing protein [Clostridia bacterium]|nr:DUF368 domain-containing protein [Clostridia bacterium]